jgi:hypothetical protein
MVRAVASPSVLYSVECIGISCASLNLIRIAAARACSASAGGKNIDILWAALDGASGAADPAFEAHEGPIKYWAIAFWEQWFEQEVLTDAIQAARGKLKVFGRSVWGRVAGPATALIATMRRLKWTWISPITVKDDIGRVLVFGLDAPKDFVTAARASVRRWRLTRITKKIHNSCRNDLMC